MCGAELHRRHDRKIEGRAALSPAARRLRRGGACGFRAARHAELSGGGADQPRRGTKVLPTLMRGGTVHMLKGFDPEAMLKTIERERINFTLLVPTMIYVLLDHPSLPKTDLSSLELLLYGASPMSPSRLVEGIERIGPVFSQLYGQTECYPVVGAAQGRSRSATAGTVPVVRLPGRRVRREDSRRQRSGQWRPARPVKSACARRM